ncbi:MAG TPA: STAS domain-containing protein [Actinomycetes bacterium]
MRSTGVRRADLVLPERLDVTTVGDLRDAMTLAVESGPAVDVLVDMSRVQVVDSVGLGLLVSTHRNCLRAGRRLVLVDPQPRMLRLLAVTRLHRVLHLQRAIDLTRAIGADAS